MNLSDIFPLPGKNISKAIDEAANSTAATEEGLRYMLENHGEHLQAVGYDFYEALSLIATLFTFGFDIECHEADFERALMGIENGFWRMMREERFEDYRGRVESRAREKP